MIRSAGMRRRAAALGLAARGADERWADIHLVSAMFGTLIAMLCEVAVLSVSVIVGFGTVEVSPHYYLTHFMFVPACCFAAVIIAVCPLRSRYRSVAPIICSASGVAIVATIYLIHSRWNASGLLLALPLVVSIGYSSHAITSLTYALLLAVKTISDFWLLGLIPWSRPKITGEADSVMDFVMACTFLMFTWAICMLFTTEERERATHASRIEMRRRALVTRSVTDPLTGIGNRFALRRAFDDMSASSGESYIAAMIDMDHFKRINDLLGHHMGDRYIKATAALIGTIPSATPFRFGGDEFCLLFRGWDIKAAAERCRALINEMKESELCREALPMTLSFGLAVWDGRIAPSDLLRQADDALYAAKEVRGIVVVWDDLDTD